VRASLSEIKALGRARFVRGGFAGAGGADDEVGVAAHIRGVSIPRQAYRTAPLRGLMTHTQGGFYHDGRFADLAAVVDYCNQFMALTLSDAEKRDLMESLKSHLA